VYNEGVSNTEATQMTTRKTDIEYITDGFWVSLMPVTQSGHDAWLHILGITGSSKIQASHFPSVKKQLKDAGYTIRKSRPTQKTDQQLLAGLGL